MSTVEERLAALEARVTALETRLPAADQSRAEVRPAVEQGQLEQNEINRRVLTALFESPDECRALKAALRAHDGDAVRATLARLNAVGGVPRDAEFGDPKIQGLEPIFVQERLRPLHPLDDADGVVAASRDFWRMLLSLRLDRLEELRALVSAYRADPTEQRQVAVVAFMKAEVDQVTHVGYDYGLRHVQALAQLSVSDPGFRQLAWFNAPGDFW